MTIEDRKIIARAQEVLEAGFQHMLEHDGNLPFDFEKQLEAAYGRGKNSPVRYTELKPHMKAIVKHPKYVYVAVRYMENHGGGGNMFSVPVCSEFKMRLSEVFGSRAILETPEELQEARKPFWAHWPEEDPRGLYKDED